MPKRIKRSLMVAILALAATLCLVMGFGVLGTTAFADESKTTTSSAPLATDYYYDSDNGNYKTSSDVLHNEWSHFFDLSLTNAGGFTKNGSTYTAKTYSPMALKIDGTWNYNAIHTENNSGNDGMHHYSYDSNGYVNGRLVEGGLVIIEYYTSSGIVYSIQSENLWQRDLSVPIEIPLSYHNGIKIRVKLCFELWKIQDGKTLYWNITEYSEPFYLRTVVSLYTKQVSPSASYTYVVDDEANIKKALYKPLTIIGINKATSADPIIRLEVQSDYLSPRATDARSRIYTGHDEINALFTAKYWDWWYNLLYDESFIEIDGKRSPLVITPEGLQVYSVDAPATSSISIRLHISIEYNFTEYMHIFGITAIDNRDNQKGYVDYYYNVPISMSNVNDGAIVFYDDIITGTGYSDVSLVENGMVRSNNTLGIVSTSKINQYSVKVEKWRNGAWSQAKSSEYKIATPSGTNNRRIVFNCVESIEKYCVTVTDNDGVKNSREFYVVSDLENAVSLTLSHEQYNAINNLPWVKELSDHKTSCLFPELLTETIEQTPVANGTKVIKKITLGNSQNGYHIGDRHDFIYEFYVGAVAAPRLNSIKFQSAKYHVLPESYSVKESSKIYAFKNYEDARSFVASLIKSNYTKPKSLSQGIQDKADFDSNIECRITHNYSQRELIEQANGNLELIYVATNAQAPIGEQILMFEDDFWGLSKTDAVSISFQNSNGNFTYAYTYGKKLTASTIASQLGYNEQIQVTEQFYDGTSISYTVTIQKGSSPIK